MNACLCILKYYVLHICVVARVYPRIYALAIQYTKLHST